jgi:hypothetical protein
LDVFDDESLVDVELVEDESLFDDSLLEEESLEDESLLEEESLEEDVSPELLDEEVSLGRDLAVDPWSFL